MQYYWLERKTTIKTFDARGSEPFGPIIWFLVALKINRVDALFFIGEPDSLNRIPILSTRVFYKKWYLQAQPILPPSWERRCSEDKYILIFAYVGRVSHFSVDLEGYSDDVAMSIIIMPMRSMLSSDKRESSASCLSRATRRQMSHSWDSIYQWVFPWVWEHVWQAWSLW